MRHNAVARRCHGRSRPPWQIGRHLLILRLGPHHPETAAAVVVTATDHGRDCRAVNSISMGNNCATTTPDRHPFRSHPVPWRWRHRRPVPPHSWRRSVPTSPLSIGICHRDYSTTSASALSSAAQKSETVLVNPIEHARSNQQWHSSHIQYC